MFPATCIEGAGAFSVVHFQSPGGKF